MRSTLFIGGQKLDQEDTTISFDHLPIVIKGLISNKLIPEHIGKNILLMELTHTEKPENISDSSSLDSKDYGYNFSEFNNLEILIEKLLSDDEEYDEEYKVEFNCKLGLIIKCCGHTLSCVFERQEDESGEVEIRLFNVDSVAYDFDGSDLLKEDFKRLLDKWCDDCQLFSTGFIGGSLKTKRQHQEGICATYALIDTIMMLTVPEITDHMMEKKNHLKKEENEDAKDVPNNIHSIEVLPPHLMVLTQSITGQSSGSYSLTNYYASIIKDKPTEEDQKLLLHLLTRSSTPRTILEDIDTKTGAAGSLVGRGCSKTFNDKLDEKNELKRAILSALGFDTASMKDIGDLTDLISQIRLYEEPYKAVIMHSINKVLYTTFRQEGDNSIEIFFNRTPINDLTPILEQGDGIWNLARLYYEFQPGPHAFAPIKNDEDLTADDTRGPTLFPKPTTGTGFAVTRMDTIQQGNNLEVTPIKKPASK